MKFVFLLLAVGTLVSIARGQAPDDVTIQRNLVYASPGNHPQALDLYIPAGLASPPPIVIYIHGGGWEGGDKAYPPPDLVRQVHGFVLACINYRLSGVAIWPAQIFDCKAAVRWLRANASKYGYNGDKIGVIGESAGGHLVSLLGTTAGVAKLEGDEGPVGVSSAVQAVVDYCGPIDFMSLPSQVTPEQRAHLDEPLTHVFGGPIWNGGPVATREASPVTYVSAQSAPTFIVHGDHDTFVPLQQSIEFYDDLKKAGVPATLWIVKGGVHGFNDLPSVLAAVQFLKQQLGVK